MGRVILNFFLVTFAAFAVIGYDVTSHGSLESSYFGRYLKGAGLLIHVKPYYSVIEEQTISVYKWGQKNFPYEEYGAVKNKTIEISKKVTNQVVVFTKDSSANIKKYSTFVFEWVSHNVKPYLSEGVLKFLNNGYNAVADVFNKIGQSTTKASKWCAQNIKRENITWENFEKAYFGFAQQVKLYYTNVSSWVGRKVTCLINS